MCGIGDEKGGKGRMRGDLAIDCWNDERGWWWWVQVPGDFGMWEDHGKNLFLSLLLLSFE